MNGEQKAFIESGVIEDYCLGIATPSAVIKLLALCKNYSEVQGVLDKNIRYFESFVQSFAKKSSIRSRDIISVAITSNIKLQDTKLFGEDQMMPEFIRISRHSKVEYWESLIADINPPSEYENIFTKPLFYSDTHELTLVWSKKMIPDEVHLDLNESFFVLEGTVDCYVEDQIFPMVKGDFMQIPQNQHHKVIVTSVIPGKAIMSRVMI